MFAAGRAPEFLKPFIAGGVSIALEKNATSVRPLCSGDPIRRLVAKCFCVAGKKQIEEAFAGRNYGVGCPGGVEVVAHSLRDTLRRHHGSDLALLKIDFRNAFNEISRRHFVAETCAKLPFLSAWTEWCYGAPTLLLYDHEHEFLSQCGVQQGDPLGPLYFCFGIMKLVNEIGGLNPIYNKWYMDDGGIIGPVPTLLKVWELIKSRGPAIGLHLNPAKCEWSWLDPARTEACPIKLDGVNEEGQVKLVPHSEIQMLGVPLGNDEFTADFVEKKLLGRLQSTIAQLVDFEDSQAALFLLRTSFGVVRAVHFMRTTPLAQWRAQADKFDAMIRDAVVQIIGYPLTAPAFAQAALTPKLGGLGVRQIVDHAAGAFSASWHEARAQSREDWLRPDQVFEEYKSQKQASFEFDEKVHQHLVQSAPNDREAQRLRRAAQPHANGFITAVPSEADGNDTILRPRVFRIAVAYRLGVPLLNDDIPCPMCKQTIDKFGDHATCCTTSGDLITRHNSLRNFVNRIAEDGMLSPIMEKQGILGPTSGRRPGDVTIPIWTSDAALAIDVAVTSPFISSQVRLESPCEHFAATKKHAKYDAVFDDSLSNRDGHIAWSSTRRGAQDALLFHDWREHAIRGSG